MDLIEIKQTLIPMRIRYVSCNCLKILIDNQKAYYDGPNEVQKIQN